MAAKVRLKKQKMPWPEDFDIGALKKPPRQSKGTEKVQMEKRSRD